MNSRKTYARNWRKSMNKHNKILKISYNREDKDVEGNTFPSLSIKDNKGNVKKIYHEDIPKLFGIDNDTEMMCFDEQIKRINKFVVNDSFFQPWLYMSDETISIWNKNVPAGLDINKPDIDIPLSLLEDNKEVEIYIE